VIRQATLHDVATLAGVSLKTVSRVVNHEPNVAAQTADRVMKAIDAAQYVPHHAARALSSGRAYAIGFAPSLGLNSLFIATLITRLLEDANERGYDLLLFPSGEGMEERVTKALSAHRVDGVVLLSRADRDRQLVPRLSALGRPYVVVYPPESETYRNTACVRIDEFGGAMQATEHLIALGHRTIGVLSFSHETFTVATQRLSGYRQALQDADIPFRADLIYESHDEPFKIGRRGARELVLEHKHMTALLAFTDEMAVAAITSIRQLGMNVPDDISVMGFDDTSIALALDVPLSTVHQPIDLVSRAAMDLVIDMTERPSSEPAHIVLPTELIVRESTQPPRAQG
jgi:LacI family transcriptional regulator, galactose operon repressor